MIHVNENLFTNPDNVWKCARKCLTPRGQWAFCATTFQEVLHEERLLKRDHGSKQGSSPYCLHTIRLAWPFDHDFLLNHVKCFWLNAWRLSKRGYLFLVINHLTSI